MANEIVEVIETSIVNNKEFNLINKKLQQHTKAIERLMNATKRNMFEISARLLVIRDEELYKEDNFKDVFEYAESLFGYKKNMVYKLVTTAEKFIQPSLNAKGYQSIISHGNEDYTVSQLIELNSVESDTAVELDNNNIINPSMTTKEIRNAVKDFKNGVIRGSDEDNEEGEQMEQRQQDKTFNLILKTIDNIDKILKDDRVQENQMNISKLLEFKSYLENIEL